MISSANTLERDPFDARLARRASGLIREFNQAGVLSAADVHVALRLTQLASERDETVQLAAALAVRGPRVGHVFVDLRTIWEIAAVDTEELVELSELRWPDPLDWVARVAASQLVAHGEDGQPSDRPLRLVGTHLYLDRYWREERAVARNLLARSGGSEPAVDFELLANGVERLFGSDSDELQRIASACAVLRRLAVVGGGPGTGKTTTVARIVALLAEQAQALGTPAPVVALAAPTAKAAARLEEAVRQQARELAVDRAIREALLELHAATLHRLLGARGLSSRFWHNRDNRLPHDVVIVDETSMVSLSMMARLLDAVSAEARLILIGDPGQLASIEAGVVLGDIVGEAAQGLRMRPSTRTRLGQAAGVDVRAGDPPAGVTIGDGIVLLERVHRFGAGIGALARAIRRGDAQAVVGTLGTGEREVAWIPCDPGDPDCEGLLAPVIDATVQAARTLVEAARANAPRDALAALGSLRVLCAHRRGPHGVADWTARIEGWLEQRIEDFDAHDRDYPGRPLLVTNNDYELRLYNGDTGVIVQDAPDHLSAMFDRGGELLRLSPTQLDAVETVYAMTIHKSQGSQFDTAAVLLPPPTSRILSRELLYTAVTRARHRLILVATEESIRAAVERPIARASGLRRRLWSSEAGRDPDLDSGSPHGSGGSRRHAD